MYLLGLKQWHQSPSKPHYGSFYSTNQGPNVGFVPIAMYISSNSIHLVTVK